MSWTPEITVPTREAALARIDGGSASGPAAFRIYDAEDALLVELPLDEPAGSVDSSTGAFTISPGDPVDAVATGEADHADLVDSDGVVLNAGLAVTEGSSPQTGYVVVSTTTIEQGAAVRLVSAEVGG